MLRSPGIVAHLIVGARPEPYLDAVLSSIASICDHAVIDDNSGSAYSHNNAVIERSALARHGRLTLLRSRFVDFSTARNACLAATPRRYRNGWVLFVDADEVHGRELPLLAKLLSRLPEEIDGVDGYSRHFVGSFSWWRTIERRLCFFRCTPRATWRGAVHEKLCGVDRRAIIPAVWSHYGHVVPPRQEWEKSRQYASLGQTGWAPNESDMAAPDADEVWGHLLKAALPYRGDHPAAVRPTIARLTTEWRAVFEDVDRIAAHRSVADRVGSRLRAANFRRLLAWRAIEARMRWGWPQSGADEPWEIQDIRPLVVSTPVASGQRR